MSVYRIKDIKRRAHLVRPAVALSVASGPSLPCPLSVVAILAVLFRVLTCHGGGRGGRRWWVVRGRGW